MIGNKIEFYEQHFGGVIKLPYQSILYFVVCLIRSDPVSELNLRSCAWAVH